MLSFWNKVGFISSVLGIIGFFGGIAIHIISNHSRFSEITLVENEQNFLKVYNSTGIAWTKKFDGQIMKSDIVNLDNNSTKYVLVSIGKNESLSNEDCGYLFCFDEKGNENWSYINNNKPNYNGGSSHKMIIKDFLVGNFIGNENQILLNNGDADGWYQSNITLIDKEGHFISTYWHPGFINKINVIKEKDNSLSIIFYGVNNDLSSLIEGEGYISVIGKLPPIFTGEAPPYAGKSKKGDEIWYFAILPKNNSIQKVSISDLNSDGTNDIAIWTKSGHNIYLDANGEIIGISATDKQNKSKFDLVRIK
ncbi:hypothetical protein PbJCM13498_34300 [Prolixibacter bellariivorans]|uniref:Uncharacterized protein n=1 Tax=Prolixibacter bellariivorans TaxID=314319 RepID=A0A5M4B4E9_9BACT|nr:hypothetical protein [Prolixibacter bellariivorans]GET34567.1 hypothetical protein PbJCM13498_34300 [Prolixibacter bellariivorans]